MAKYAISGGCAVGLVEVHLAERPVEDAAGDLTPPCSSRRDVTRHVASQWRKLNSRAAMFRTAARSLFSSRPRTLDIRAGRRAGPPRRPAGAWGSGHGGRPRLHRLRSAGGKQDRVERGGRADVEAVALGRPRRRWRRSRGRGPCRAACRRGRRVDAVAGARPDAAGARRAGSRRSRRLSHRANSRPVSVPSSATSSTRMFFGRPCRTRRAALVEREREPVGRSKSSATISSAPCG